MNTVADGLASLSFHQEGRVEDEGEGGTTVETEGDKGKKKVALKAKHKEQQKNFTLNRNVNK